MVFSFAQRRNKDPKYRTSFRPRMELLESRTLLATIRWINPDGDNWQTAANWDLQRVPAADDEVLIDLPGNGTVTYSRDTGETTIRNLFSTRPLTLARGILSVEETVRVQNLFLMTGGTLNYATLAAGTTLHSRGGSSTLRDVTLAGNLDIATNAGSIVTLTGNWRNLGTMSLTTGVLTLGGTFTRADLGDFRRQGGGVRLSGTLDNTGQTLTLNAAAGSWQMLAGTIVGGVVTMTEGTRLAVISDTSTMNGVTVNGPLDITGTLRVQNGLTVNGVVSLGIAGDSGNLSFQGENRLLAGACTIVIDNAGFSDLSSTDVPVVLAPTVRVRNGSGRLINVINQGVIEVTSPGARLTLQGEWRNEGTIFLTAGTFNLGGTFAAEALGTFHRLGGTVNLTGSYDNTDRILTLNAATGSWVLSSGTIRGGIVRATQGAALLTGPASGFGGLDGVTLETDVAIPNPFFRLALSGAWRNRATITIGNGILELGGTFTTDALGTIRRNGGSFNLSGTLDNTGRTLTLDNSTGDLALMGGIITGGTIVTQGTARLLSGVSSNNRLSGVTLNGTLSLPIIYGVTVTNGLTLNGTVQLIGNVSNGAFLEFPGDQLLSGTGSVVFVGAEPRNALRSTNGTLTIGQGITVRGGAGRLQNIVNRGTIELAAANASLTLAGSWRNEGVIRLSDGILILSSTFTRAALGDLQRTGGSVQVTGILDNVGSTLVLDAATGSWRLNGTIRGGTVTTRDGAALLPVGGCTLDGVTVETDLALPSNSTLSLRGAWHNHGTITVDNGSLSLEGETWTNEGVLVLQRGIVNLRGTFLPTALGKFQRTGGSIRMFGTLDNTESELLLDAATGSWEMWGGTINGGTVVTTDGAQLLTRNGTSRLNGVVVNGELDVLTSLVVSGGLTLNGTLTASGSVEFSGDQTLGGAATVVLISSGSLRGMNGVLTLAPSVTVRGRGLLLNVSNQGTIIADAQAGNFTLAGAWSNAGSLQLVSGTLVLSGTFSMASLAKFTREGGVVNLTGTLDNTGQKLTLDARTGSWNLSNGTILGGTITTADGATLTPTLQGGTLRDVTLNTDLTLPANTRLTLAGNWINHGLLTISGGVLTFTAGTWSNKGTLNLMSGSLTLGGTFTLAALGELRRTGGGVTLSGRLLNTGGTLTLDDTTGSWFSTSGTIVGGTVVTKGQARLMFTGSSSRLEGVTLNGTAEVRALVDVMAGLTLNGTFFVGSGGTAGHLRVFGGATIGGTGTLVLSNGSNLLEAAQAQGTWVLGAGVTIQGGRGVLSNLINQGTIALSDPTALITLTGMGWRNEGIVTLEAGILNLSGSFTTADIGTLQRTGGTVRIAGTLTNTDNNLVLNAATGSWEVNGNDARINGGTITGTEGAGLFITGSALLNAVTLAIDVTLTSTGRLSLVGAWSNQGILRQLGGTLSLGGTFTLTALGDFRYTDGLVQLTGTLDNTGTTLALNAGTGSWTLFGGTILGGSVTTADSARLHVGTSTSSRLDGVTLNGRLDIDSGALRIRNGLTVNGRVKLGQSSRGYGALLFEETQGLDGTGTILIAGNDATRAGLAVVTSNSTLTLSAGLTVQGGHGFIGYSSVWASAAANVRVVNHATIRSEVRGRAVTVTARDIENHGTLHVTERAGLVLTRREGGVVVNYGTVVIDAGCTLNSGDGYEQANEGVTQLNGGTFQASVINLEGGVLSGSGVIFGNVINRARVEVGGVGTTGILEIHGNYTQTSTGVLALDLGGRLPGVQHDVLSVTGIAALNATLEVRVLDGYFAAPGDAFQQLSCGRRSGEFTEIEGLFPEGPVYFDPTMDDFGLVLTAVLY